jgi:phosphonate transport system substrate-binding protein
MKSLFIDFFDINKMTKKKIIYSLTVLLIIAFVFTILFYNYSLNIERVIKTEPDETVIDSTILSKPVAYIGVISRYPPNIIYRGYQPILDYLTSRTDYRFELKLSDDYNKAVKMLVNKEVVAAFLGSYVYSNAHKQYGVIPILKPLNENFEPFSRSVLFTNSSSDIYSINDLKNKKIALPSKESFSSNWLLKYEFVKYKLKEKDLADIRIFPHHQSVIHNVLKKYYDAGVTREYLLKKINDGSIRVLLYSDPYPTSPLVVAPDYPKQIIDAVMKTLLAINQKNPDRLTITKDWDYEFIYGFVEATDSDYEIIRTISK